MTEEKLDDSTNLTWTNGDVSFRLQTPACDPSNIDILLAQVSRSILIGARSHSTQEGCDKYIVNDETTHHYSVEFDNTMSIYSECINRTSQISASESEQKDKKNEKKHCLRSFDVRLCRLAFTRFH